MKTQIIRLILYSCCTISLIACDAENTKNTSKANAEQTKPDIDDKAAVSQVHDFLKEGNKGIGTITSFEHQSFDQQLADKGNKLFIVKCTMCHEIKEEKIGPALYGVTKKRTPEWMMNMILNPDKMLAEDADAKLLSTAYAGVMPTLGLLPAEARAVLEYLRQEDSK